MSRTIERIWLILVSVMGGVTGILLGLVILEWIHPGHPAYQGTHEFLKRLLGL